MAEFKIEALTKRHHRSSFSCGVDELDLWLQQFSTQNEKLRLTRTFVAVQGTSNAIVGYYAIRAGEVTTADVPEHLKKRLPKYPIPVLHLARLAVDSSAQGKGLGEFLLMDCLARAIELSEALGLHAVEVHALTQAAASFYEKYGFTALLDDKHHLYLPIKTAVEAFRGA